MTRRASHPMSRMRYAARHPAVHVASGAVLLLLALLVWPLGRQLITRPGTVSMVAVGDMACDPKDPDMRHATPAASEHCRHQEVSDLAVALSPDVLLGLGDYQYELPTAGSYRTVYGPSFGRLRGRTVPVVGNQEYKVQDAGSYVRYFGDRVVDPRGYWSQDVGSWHVVVLNSNCAIVVGGCRNGSPQQAWLDDDLAATDRRCVLAAWHHPRWSSGLAGSDSRTDDLFRTLYRHRVELVLSGHEADYERFGPLDPTGRTDKNGVRQFVVGTGGQAHYRPVVRARPLGEYADFDHHGVLALQLAPNGYSWAFHPLDGPATTEDEGSADCR